MQNFTVRPSERRAKEYRSSPSRVAARHRRGRQGPARVGDRHRGRTFLVGAISHNTGVVLGQRGSPTRREKAPRWKPCWRRWTRPGWSVITLDALHTTRTTARLITDTLAAHYVLILKGNQRLARAAADRVLTGPDSDWAQTSAVLDDRGHGSRERRSIRTTEVDDTLFPRARQVFRLRRDVGELDGPGTTKKIIYGVTSLPAALAAPAYLNYYQRQHRTVENRLHWTRDVSFGEDNSQVRTGTTPRAIATFRNWRSTRSDSQDAPTSPMPAETSSTTTPPSPPSASTRIRSH